MKSRLFNEQQSISVNSYHNNSLPQFVPMRPSLIARDFSNDQKIKKMSPMPQERFSQLSSNFVYPISSFPPNQYQLPIRSLDQSISAFDSKRTMQDLIARLQKLEVRSQKLDKVEFRMDKLENTVAKFQTKIQNYENKSQQFVQSNENRMNLSNCAQKNQDQMKQKIKNLITRQELQRQLIGLDSVFKTLIKDMKSNTSLQMREIHSKEKKTMIEVVASQISEKLQAFKSNFLLQLSNKIEQSVRQHFNSHILTKNLLGVEKQTFLGNAVSLKIHQQVRFTSNGVEKTLAISEVSYFVDTQGFILDSNLIYLLDKNNSKIKLSQNHMDTLRREGLLNQSNDGYRMSAKSSSSVSFNDK